MEPHLVVLDDWGWEHGHASTDAATIWFLFSSRPKSPPPTDPGRAGRLTIRVGLSRSLLRAKGWALPVEEITLHAFAYAQECLQRDGLPARERIHLSLTTHTDRGRFRDGPPYVLDSILADAPFEVLQGTVAAGAEKVTGA